MRKRSTFSMKPRPAMFVLLLVLVVGCQSQRIPQNILITHFRSDRLDKSKLELLQKFEEIPSSDSAGARSFVERHRDRLRSTFSDLLNQLIFQELLNSSQSLPVTYQDSERLAAVFGDVNEEPAPLRRLQLVKNFDTAQKWQKLEAEYFMFTGDTLREHDKEQAIKRYEDAISCYRKIDDRQGEAEAYYEIGKANHSLGKSIESLAAYDQSLTLARDVNESFQEMLTLFRSALVQADLRKYQESEERLKQAIVLSQALKKRKVEAQARSKLGSIYCETGRLEKSLEYLNAALQLLNDLDEPFDKAQALRRLGFTYESLGDYANAATVHEAGLQIFRTADLLNHEAAQYTNLGQIYGLLGQHELALKSHDAALKLFRTEGRPVDIATALANMGEAYANLGNLGEANSCLNEALRQVDDSANVAIRAEVYQMIGDVKLRQKDWPAAGAIFSQALQINNKNGYISGQILNHIGLGQVALENNSYEQADGFFDQAIALSQKSKITAHLWKGYYGKALALKANGKISDALRNLVTAVDSIEATMSSLREEGSKLGYFAEKQNVYDELILTYLVAKQDPRQAFDFVERAKARSFFDLLHGSIEIVKKANMLDHDKDDLALLSISALSRPSLQDIQNTLGTQDKIIEYRVLSDRLAIWVISKNRFEAVQVPIYREELRSLVRRFRKAAGADDFMAFSARWDQNRLVTFQEFLEISRQLSSLLIEPIWQNFQTGDNIYIVPDDLLHYLPFAALTQPEPNSDKFLIEVAPLATAPSAAVLKYAIEKGRNHSNTSHMRVLAVADPVDDSGKLKELPWAQKTAQSILKSSSPDSRMLTREQACKDSILQALQEDFDILHFAVHCSVDVKSPLYTTLYLTEHKSSDRLHEGNANVTSYAKTDAHLRMHEVFSLNLKKTRLIVLSACNTALGQFSGGEGIVGISRAFMYAGASSLITTLWAVDARATANVMEKFYLNLQGGDFDIGGALQNAQTSEIARMRRDPVMRYCPHPYFWAPFLAVGNSYETKFFVSAVHHSKRIAQNH